MHRDLALDLLWPMAANTVLFKKWSNDILVALKALRRCITSDRRCATDVVTGDDPHRRARDSA